jgi:hypothetical protein
MRVVYRKISSGVKSDYAIFLDLILKIINNIHAIEFNGDITGIRVGPLK